MPSLGADMDDGVLLEWLVQPGAQVHKGDIVAVVDTAKAAVEVETFTTGVVEQLLVQPGQRVPVGAVLATIAESAEKPEPAGPPAPPVAPRVSDTSGQPLASPPVRHLATLRHVDLHTVHGTGPGGRIVRADVEHVVAECMPESIPVTSAPAASALRPVPDSARPRVSPLARRRAAESGVDLATLVGTGPDGAIDADDVHRAVAALRPPGPTGPGPTRTDAMRAAIATSMARSKREIPHYYLAETIDLGPALDWLHERNRHLSVAQRLVPAALLLKAAALAVREVPQLNGFWRDDRFVPAEGIHLGVAVALRGGGLVAPAVHDAADLDLAELMARMRDLVTRTRAGRLRRAELSDPTITVSNLGDQGVESILGVIYPPQVALVGFGRISERPWAVEGLLGVRPLVVASLAADHRAADGATGAHYLRAVSRLLNTPEELR